MWGALCCRSRVLPKRPSTYAGRALSESERVPENSTRVSHGLASEVLAGGS